MRTHLTLPRRALVLLLVVTGCLFAIGSTIERHHRHHQETSVHSQRNAHEEEGTNGEAGVKILGVDTESTTLSIVGVVASLLLAAVVWLRPARIVLLGVLVFALLFAAGDGRELAHQLSESNNGIAAIAATLLVLHVATAALAAVVASAAQRQSAR